MRGRVGRCRDSSTSKGPRGSSPRAFLLVRRFLEAHSALSPRPLPVVSLRLQSIDFMVVDATVTPHAPAGLLHVPRRRLPRHRHGVRNDGRPDRSATRAGTRRSNDAGLRTAARLRPRPSTVTRTRSVAADFSGELTAEASAGLETDPNVLGIGAGHLADPRSPVLPVAFVPLPPPVCPQDETSSRRFPAGRLAASILAPRRSCSRIPRVNGRARVATAALAEGESRAV